MLTILLLKNILKEIQIVHIYNNSIEITYHNFPKKIEVIDE